MTLMNTLTVDASTSADESDVDQVLEIGGVGWEGYRRYLRARGQRSRPRMIYLDGDLTLVSPSELHESWNWRLGMFVVEVCLPLRIHFRPLGHTTLRRRGRRGGIEGDQVYYLASEARVRGKPKVNLRVDPPPDLAVEVVISHKADASIKVYQKLGVPEVWVCEQGRVTILVRQDNGTYQSAEQSSVLPFLSAREIFAQTQRPDDMADLDWVEGLRQWVREVLVPRVHPT